MQTFSSEDFLVNSAAYKPNYTGKVAQEGDLPWQEEFDKFCGIEDAFDKVNYGVRTLIPAIVKAKEDVLDVVAQNLEELSELSKTFNEAQQAFNKFADETDRDDLFEKSTKAQTLYEDFTEKMNAFIGKIGSSDPSLIPEDIKTQVVNAAEASLKRGGETEKERIEYLLKGYEPDNMNHSKQENANDYWYSWKDPEGKTDPTAEWKLESRNWSKESENYGMGPFLNDFNVIKSGINNLSAETQIDMQYKIGEYESWLGTMKAGYELCKKSCQAPIDRLKQ